MNRFIYTVLFLVVIIASSSSQFAQAATTPSSSQPIKSAALLDLQSRIISLKKNVNQAVKMSGLGEAIKFGGYLNTLAGLEMASITSLPVAELSFYLANIGLTQNVVNVVSQILYVAGNSVSLSGALINLQLARQACPSCPLLADPSVNSTNLNHSDSANNPIDSMYMANLQSVMTSLDPTTLDRLISQSQTSQYDIASLFVLQGGVNQLLDLSTQLMQVNQNSLLNIQSVSPSTEMVTH
jgi:hypothetical protein